MADADAEVPCAVVVFSGKRKSGKDFVTDQLQRRLGEDKCELIRLSGPLKSQYAKEHGLDLERLLDASEYKETYRLDMIRWGEERRNQDPGYFCSLATRCPGAQKPVWVITDARRKTDIQYFRGKFGTRAISVRVEAQGEVRRKRGWVFTSGVDDAESECDLDEGVTWDVVIANNGEHTQLREQLDQLEHSIKERLRNVTLG
ncbi:phosphomevalonate kinase-like isoform X1 [Branchiostoma floridae]|uniref:Phosphomevalonate kinase n=1 Tax=Branchiostoma floridae TaxID=7739 RepID=C3Y1G0_BRAFL|nr:phosphomevalonate kinase-like isoform X1 [Branchiostoma floridae]|eukprot:XP_002609690.1 hypothetical protein BRAFLDRAFT_114776 [Branchiostoma floridae]